MPRRRGVVTREGDSRGQRCLSLRRDFTRLAMKFGHAVSARRRDAYADLQRTLGMLWDEWLENAKKTKENNRLLVQRRNEGPLDAVCRDVAPGGAPHGAHSLCCACIHERIFETSGGCLALLECLRASAGLADISAVGTPLVTVTSDCGICW